MWQDSLRIIPGTMRRPPGSLIALAISLDQIGPSRRGPAPPPLVVFGDRFRICHCANMFMFPARARV